MSWRKWPEVFLIRILELVEPGGVSEQQQPPGNTQDGLGVLYYFLLSGRDVSQWLCEASFFWAGWCQWIWIWKKEQRLKAHMFWKCETGRLEMCGMLVSPLRWNILNPHSWIIYSFVQTRGMQDFYLRTMYGGIRVSVAMEVLCPPNSWVANFNYPASFPPSPFSYFCGGDQRWWLQWSVHGWRRRLESVGSQHSLAVFNGGHSIFH